MGLGLGLGSGLAIGLEIWFELRGEHLRLLGAPLLLTRQLGLGRLLQVRVRVRVLGC